MRSQPPPGIAKFDSAAAMTLALARFLRGRDFPGLGQSRLLQLVVPFADRVPRRLRQGIFAKLGAAEGIAPEQVHHVSAASVAEWVTGLYPARRYPAAMIGSSNGAAIHLAAAFGIPWLPQTFLTLVRQSGIDPDDPKAAMAAAEAPAQRFLSANPEVQLHHMHDPIQDRLMLRYITYFRSKFRGLPPAYRSFIERSLEPGGTIVLVECERSWPTTRLGDRHLFQFGALGGATQEEYLEGSERVTAALARHGSPRRRWEPPPADAEGPEAEWGYEPALSDSIGEFARDRGYRLVRIIFGEPEHLSPPVADFHRRWYRETELPGDRLMVESFILIEPYWALRTASVPFWMKFNTEVSLDAVRRYLADAEPFECLHLMLFAHGADSVGLPSIEAWQELLAEGRQGGSLLGIDPRAYPAHFGTFARYHTAARRIGTRQPLPEPIPFERFDEWLEGGGAAYPVRMVSQPADH